MSLKEDDVVLCTVSKIDSAAVFVDIDSDPTIKGGIVMSEIAAGRIRNLREYVSLNKKIVCKVLKVSKDHAELSLRRVTAKEHDEVMQKYKEEQTYKNILSAALKNDKPALENILKKYSATEFALQVRSNPEIVKKFLKKDESELLQKMLAEKKEVAKKARKKFVLSSTSSTGLLDIKEALAIKEADIKYLGSSVFSLEVEGKDFKDANHKAETMLSDIEKKAKDRKMHFELKA